MAQLCRKLRQLYSSGRRQLQKLHRNPSLHENLNQQVPLAEESSRIDLLAANPEQNTCQKKHAKQVSQQQYIEIFGTLVSRLCTKCKSQMSTDTLFWMLWPAADLSMTPVSCEERAWNLFGPKNCQTGSALVSFGQKELYGHSPSFCTGPCILFKGSVKLTSATWAWDGLLLVEAADTPAHDLLTCKLTYLQEA